MDLRLSCIVEDVVTAAEQMGASAEVPLLVHTCCMWQQPLTEYHSS